MSRLSTSALGRLREVAGFSQLEVAEKLSASVRPTSQASFSDYERGERRLPEPFVVQLAKLYQLDAEKIRAASEADWIRYGQRLNDARSAHRKPRRSA